MVVTAWPNCRVGAGRPGGTTGSWSTKEDIEDTNQSARFCVKKRMFLIVVYAFVKYQFPKAKKTYIVRNRKIAVMMVKKLCQSTTKTC